MTDWAAIRKRLAVDPQDAGALRAAANFYLGEGEYRQARKVFEQALASQPRLLPWLLLDYEKALQKEPDKIGLRFSLAGFLLSSESLESAEQELEEMIEVFSRPDDPLAAGRLVEAYNVLGRFYIKRERLDEAIALLERSLASGIRDVSLTEILASAYLEKGRRSEAISFYEEILEQKPGNKQILRILAELNTQQEDFLKAARCWRDMFSDDPEVAREVIQKLEELLKNVEGSIEIREILAEVYIKTINPEAAVARLHEIIRLEPTKNLKVIETLKNILKNYPDLPVALIALAEGLARHGDYSEAVEYYRLLLTRHPEKGEEAIAGYRQILALCPEQILARSYLGDALLEKGELEEALQEYSRMVEFDPLVTDQVIKKCRDILKEKPDLALAHFVLGRAYLVKGDFQRAIICAETIISRDKNSVPAQLLLGEAQARLGLTGRAAAALLAAQKAEPYNLEIIRKYREVRRCQVAEEIAALKNKLSEDQWKVSLRLDLAKLYWENGNEEEAIRELQLVQKDPARLAEALLLSGNIYRASGRYDLASANYRRGLEQASKELSRKLRAALGSAHEALGEVKQAIKLYEEILQEELDYGDLKERVKWLKNSSLQSLRQRPLLAALAFPMEKEIIALWGRENRPAGRGGKKEEVNASFGQEHSQAGYDYFCKGMYPAAEEELLLAVQLDRHFASALNNLGIVLLKEGKLAEARSRLLEASRLDPDSAIFANNLGLAEFILGQPDKAGKLLTKARQLDERSAAIALNLGDLLCAAGQGEEGIALYRQISDSDPLADLVWRRLPRHSA